MMMMSPDQVELQIREEASINVGKPIQSFEFQEEDDENDSSAGAYRRVTLEGITQNQAKSNRLDTLSPDKDFAELQTK